MDRERLQALNLAAANEPRRDAELIKRFFAKYQQPTIASYVEPLVTFVVLLRRRSVPLLDAIIHDRHCMVRIDHTFVRDYARIPSVSLRY